MPNPLEDLLAEARAEGQAEGARHVLAVARRHPRVTATRLPADEVSPREAAFRLAVEEMFTDLDLEVGDV